MLPPRPLLPPDRNAWRGPAAAALAGVCRPAAACLALWAAAGLAQAQGLQGAVNGRAPSDCETPALLGQPADVLHLALQRCEQSAPYLLRLGTLRNQQARYEQAADHLERALMLAPGEPEALLQYAIALAGSGDTLSALNLMADLQKRPDLPDPLRASLRSVVATWAPVVQGPIWAAAGAAAAPAAFTRFSAGTRLGYDSNLQGSSRISSLTLTLPGESVTLPIEPSQLPRSGGVLQTDLRATHQRMLPSGARWGTQAALQQRYTPSLLAAGSTQAEWQVDFTAAPVQKSSAAIEKEAVNIPGSRSGGWAPWVSASVAALHGRSGTRYASQSLSLGIEHAALGCAARWGIDGQNRELRSNPILSGRYLGGSVQWHCAPAPNGLQWLAVLRVGQDRATNPARPGGDQNQAGLRLHANAPAPNLWEPVAGTAGQGGARWVLDADYSHARDHHGYSPLLSNGRVRRVDRLTARMEWQQPVRPGVQAVVGAEAIVQHSSLSLFQVRSQGVWVGLRGQW